MGLIGLLVGLLGFVLHQLIDLIATTKWEMAKTLVRTEVFLAWAWIFGYSLVSFENNCLDCENYLFFRA